MNVGQIPGRVGVSRSTATGAAPSGRRGAVLIEDGLRRTGLADRISTRFRELHEWSPADGLARRRSRWNKDSDSLSGPVFRCSDEAMPNLSGSQEITTPGSTTVTFPPGVICYQVEAWGGAGGGGGGGGTSGSAGSGGGAGGSGAYVRTTQTTTSGSLTIVVGAGGNGGAAGAGGGSTGGNGGTTTVTDGGTVTVSAAGGSGGLGGASTNPPGSATVGGAGGSAGSIAGSQGFTRAGSAGGAASGVNGGAPGGYPGSGVLPAQPNTGGRGGNGSTLAFGSIPASASGNGANGNPGQVLVSWFVLVPWPSGGQPLQPYSGTTNGQTINIRNSYTYLECTGSGVVVHVSLAQTNQPNARFHVYYKLDGSPPIDSGVFFGTDAQGNGGATLTITGMGAGAHAFLPEINLASNELTYYIGSGIQFSN